MADGQWPVRKTGVRNQESEESEGRSQKAEDPLGYCGEGGSVSTMYPIPGPWTGQLAILARPRGGDWLEDEIRGWRSSGIEMVVSLLELEEQDELGLPKRDRWQKRTTFASFPFRSSTALFPDRFPLLPRCLRKCAKHSITEKPLAFTAARASDDRR